MNNILNGIKEGLLLGIGLMLAYLGAKVLKFAINLVGLIVVVLGFMALAAYMNA